MISDKQKLREFVATRSALQEILKEVIRREGKYVRNSDLQKERKIIRERMIES